MNSLSPSPAPQVCPSRVEQSNRQHSALIVLNTSSYFLACKFSRDSRVSPELPSSCMVKTASDSNSLKASKKSQSMVLPSETLLYRYSAAYENLANLDANLRLSSAGGAFLIALSLSWACERILSNDGVSLFLMRVSAQQKRMAVSRWFEQKSLFTFSKSEMEALLEADRSEPSFSLCFCNFSSSFTSYDRNRQSECVSSCAWRLPSTILEQNLLSSLKYSCCIAYITIIAGKRSQAEILKPATHPPTETIPPQKSLIHQQHAFRPYFPPCGFFPKTMFSSVLVFMDSCLLIVDWAPSAGGALDLAVGSLTSGSWAATSLKNY